VGNDTSPVANLLLSPTVKEFLKSANISQSYEQISSGTFIWHPVYFYARVSLVLPLGCSTANNGVTLKSVLEVAHPTNLCTICLSMKSTYRTRDYLFIADSTGPSSFASMQRAPEKAMALRCCVAVV